MKLEGRYRLTEKREMLFSDGIPLWVITLMPVNSNGFPGGALITMHVSDVEYRSLELGSEYDFSAKPVTRAEYVIRCAVCNSTGRQVRKISHYLSHYPDHSHEQVTAWVCRTDDERCLKAWMKHTPVDQ